MKDLAKSRIYACVAVVLYMFGTVDFFGNDLISASSLLFSLASFVMLAFTSLVNTGEKKLGIKKKKTTKSQKVIEDIAVFFILLFIFSILAWACISIFLVFADEKYSQWFIDVMSYLKPNPVVLLITILLTCIGILIFYIFRFKEFIIRLKTLSKGFDIDLPLLAVSELFAVICLVVTVVSAALPFGLNMLYESEIKIPWQGFAGLIAALLFNTFCLFNTAKKLAPHYTEPQLDTTDDIETKHEKGRES
ncbi:MAG: hypothetical protein FWG82_05880 [Oscillospiraceae bacterium]|nr:hypothetical protein [Oscillospiraceae bacterium]